MNIHIYLPMLYEVEDSMHAEIVSRHSTRDEALEAIRRIVAVPWGKQPNRPPCTHGDDCRRVYELVEYDDCTKPFWTELKRERVVTVSKIGAVYK